MFLINNNGINNNDSNCLLLAFHVHAISPRDTTISSQQVSPIPNSFRLIDSLSSYYICLS